jgi:hypothetical protein
MHNLTDQGSITEGEGSEPFVPTSLYQFLFILKILNTFFAKRSHLNEEVNCTGPSPQLVFPGPI